MSISKTTAETWAESADRAHGAVLALDLWVERRFPQPTTILLVDDNPALRSLITRFLTRDGLVVINEDTSEGALEVARRYGRVLDLLITDVQMTGQDGITLALEFRTMCPDIPVLLLTGFWNPRLEVLRRTGMHCLVKPFSQRQLAAAVRELLSAPREVRDGTQDHSYE